MEDWGGSYQLAALLIYLPRRGDNLVTFRSSSQAATSDYQSNYSEVEAIS